MATKVVMEALSPTMEEGRLVEWKKNVGDPVATGDVLAEVETDKAVMELVARADGVLLQQVVPAGSTVPVADVVGWIGAAGEATPATGNQKLETGSANTDAGTAEPAAAPAVSSFQSPVSAPTPSSTGRIKASPVARKIAAEKGLDLSAITGSGPEGRVIKRDVEGTAAAPAGTAPTAQRVAADGHVDVPLTQMRKVIAKRLSQSIGPIPTFYLTAEVDMERAAEARDALLSRNPDGKFSFNDFIIRATAEALRLHPWVNSWWMDSHIRQWNEIHIGVAVAIEDGLLTPVIRNADTKGLRDIGAEVRELAGRARSKKLQPDEYTGATFTISNLGMFGIDEFTAIINPPEVAILAVGRIEPRAVVVDGQVSVRRRMRITLSCDHRVVDGATGAEFLKTLVGMLENPMAMIY